MKIIDPNVFNNRIMIDDFLVKVLHDIDSTINKVATTPKISTQFIYQLPHKIELGLFATID